MNLKIWFQDLLGRFGVSCDAVARYVLSRQMSSLRGTDIEIQNYEIIPLLYHCLADGLVGYSGVPVENIW